MMKYNLQSCLLAMAIGAWTAATAAPSADIHVATSGNDANDGGISSPVATPQRAVEIVRGKLRNGEKADIRVMFGSGRYELEHPLKLGPEDSAGPGQAIIYAALPGESVVFSGARQLPTWEPDANGIWSTAIPPDLRRDPPPTALYVDGKPGLRASGARGAIVSVEYDRRNFCTGVHLPPGCLAGTGKSPDGAELVMLGKWATMRKHVAAWDASSGAIRFAPPHHAEAVSGWNAPGIGQIAWLENDAAFLGTPGTWCAEVKRGRLLYRPLPGQKPDGLEAVLPRLQQLLIIRGTEQRPVENIRFEGIIFESTAWSLPPGGYIGTRADRYIPAGSEGNQTARPPAAIQLEFAHNCVLRDGSIRHIAGSAIELGSGTTGNIIEALTIEDVGGCGLVLGAESGADDPAPAGNAIRNNSIRACGRQFAGASGIWIGSAHGTRIEHNEIADMPQSGILLGWTDDRSTLKCRDNRISGNLIHRIGAELGDSGGIQVFGVQDGGVIEANHIFDVHGSPLDYALDNTGLLFDENSAGLIVERNLVSAHPPVRFQSASHNTFVFTNNAFHAPGIRGGGLSVLGVEDAIVLPGEGLDPVQLTIECWMKWTHDMRATNSPKHLVAEGRLYADRWALGFVGEAHAWAVWPGIGELKTEQPVVKRGEWHHLAMTCDGETLTLYVDGKPAAAKGGGTPRAPSPDGLFRIGHRYFEFPPFRGTLDEIRLYDRALSAGEIERNFKAAASNEGEPASFITDGLIRAWDFDPPAAAMNAVSNAGK